MTNASEMCQIAASAVRHESKSRYGRLPNIDEAWDVLEELARTYPELIASKFHRLHGDSEYWQRRFCKLATAKRKRCG